MSRAVAAFIAVVMVTSLAAAPAVGASSNASLQTPSGFDSTTFRITVHENGSAVWAIEHRQPLENGTDVDRFNAYADRFENNETELYTNFREDAQVLTQVGTDATGREMEARNFQRSANVDPAQSQGTVRMSFLWTNFAATSEGRVIVSDVFDGGFYIGDGQSMVIERADSLRYLDVRPDPASQSDPESLANSTSVSWIGEQSFNDSRPYVVLGPPSAVQDDANGTPAGETSSSGMFVLALAVLALGAVAVAAWRSGAAAAILGSDEDDDGGASAATADQSPEPAPEAEEFLDDSDRVLRLLEDNGGRMKQVDIVDNTEWSKSKVSMLLSDMEDDGEISKLRVGRENIISLAGEEPDAAGSPFDEE